MHSLVCHWHQYVVASASVLNMMRAGSEYEPDRAPSITDRSEMVGGSRCRSIHKIGFLNADALWKFVCARRYTITTRANQSRCQPWQEHESFSVDLRKAIFHALLHDSYHLDLAHLTVSVTQNPSIS